MRKHRCIQVALVLFAIAVMHGCAPRKPEPSLVRLYERLKEPLQEADLSGIKHRRILIDPGHGGVFPGAIGHRGLRESDVNLGVALYLWGLLTEAGAEVNLTRSTDRDFVNGDSLRLRDDLAARVEIANQLRPDVFISLHHNAESGGDSSFNEIQIYHKFDDRGPSLDMARLMAKHLLVNLGEPDCRVLPGNYYVLRNAQVPSILCEPSYLSNPAVESKLKLAEKQRLEAESYFLGLVDYFSRGVPQVTRVEPSGVISDSRPAVEAVFDSLPLIDAATVRIKVDGADLHISSPEPNRFVAFPGVDLNSGRHTATVSARSLGGNASPPAATVFRIHLEPAALRLQSTPLRPNPPYPQKISALVEDMNGNPVADSTIVQFIWDGGKAERPTMSGRASVFVGQDVGFDRTYVAAVCEGVPGDIKLTEERSRNTVSGFVRDAASRPVAGAMVTEPVSRAYALTDELGFFAVDTPENVTALEVLATGYRKTYYWVKRSEVPLVKLDRLYSELPARAVVTVDPVGGGSETGHISRAGIKAADLNLGVARKLAHLLRAAGVIVNMTRDDDQRVTSEERVLKNEQAGSDLFISIGHVPAAGSPVDISHYHGSLHGQELAARIKTYSKRLLELDATTGPTSSYVIQQTSCPAVRVVYAVPGAFEGRGSPSDLSAVWRRAYVLFCAVLAQLGVDADKTFSARALVTDAGKPAPGSMVRLDGTIDMMADGDGSLRLELMEIGEHTIVAFAGKAESAPVLFSEENPLVELELK